MDNDDEPGSPRPAPSKIQEAYTRLYRTGHSLAKLKDSILGERLFDDLRESTGVAGRSLAWKIFLIQPGPLQPPEDQPPRLSAYVEGLRNLRNQFTSLLLEKMRAPDGSYEDGFTIPGTGAMPDRPGSRPNNLERNNPLSLHNENPWNAWFAAVDLRRTILQDVERTFPDIAYFRSSSVQEQLTNILYLYSVMHPTVGYRQGMHELLASLYYAVDFDSLQDPSPDLDEELCELCARRWVVADAWALFNSVMSSAGKWYEWREDQQPPSEQLGRLAEPYVAPILQACNKIQREILSRVDPALADSLERAGIEPQIYGIRWLRLLFTREYSMQDAMRIWDGLFAVDPSLDLVPWICVAMLIRIRNRLIPSDYSAQLTYLLRYPTPSIPTSTHHATLLLHQALTLQMSPTPTTGATITIENRNILGIPFEVPDPPPPPVRRNARPGDSQRRQTMSSETSAPETGPSGHPASLGRTGGVSVGIPEMLARGLLDRGEALGLNKTILNAVSEIKRNLPDLAANLGVRAPSASDNASTTYPLVLERSPEERPPWEPRTRFEMEREISQLQTTRKKLGESIGRIVDTLLLDEAGDAARTQHVQAKKREALESLAYVRDVLLGAVPDKDIDDERLLGEEEFRARKALAEQEAHNRAAAEQERIRASRGFQRHRSSPSMPTLNITAVSPPPPAAPPSAHAATPRTSSASTSLNNKASRSTLRMPAPASSAFIAKPTSQSPESDKPAVTSPTSRGPWSYTRSDFSGKSGFGASVASLMAPPRASVSGHPSEEIPPSGRTLAREGPAINGAGSGNVQHDPLGVL